MINQKTHKLSIILKRTSAVKKNKKRGEEGYNPTAIAPGRFMKNGRPMTMSRAAKYDRKIGNSRQEHVAIEEIPASLGHFSLAQLKEIIHEIELNPAKKEWHFYWGKPNEVFIVTVAKIESDEED